LKEKLKKRELDELRSEAKIAVREGGNNLILPDKKNNEKKAPIPMALAIGAINSRLSDLGIRGFASINVQTSETLDTHSFAVFIGCRSYNDKFLRCF
jgi:Glutamate synthase central domain.